MRIFIATIDEAFDLSLSLDKSWHDFAKDFGKNRARTYLAGRGLLQKILNDYYDVKKLPTIKRSSHGKPYFLESRYPNFNISHSGKSICISVGQSEQGLDVEYVKQRKLFTGLKSKILSNDEKAYFENLDDNNAISLFTALWTLRECLMKVTGRGLIDMSAIDVNFTNKSANYYLASNLDLSIKTVNFEKLIETNPAFMTFAIPKNESVEFIKLSKNNFIKLTTPPFAFEYKLI